MGDNAANRLLATLTHEDMALLKPGLEPVELRHGTVLAQEGEPLRHVYFPQTAVVSLIRAMADGRMAEMATFGREALVGLSFDGIPLESFGRYIVQISGTASRIGFDTLQEAAAARPGIQTMILRYTEMLMALTLQSVACNAAHSIESRCCRWIVATRDRMNRDDIPLTHEILSGLLGVQRSTVSKVVHSLQDRGLIRQGRGMITVLDRTRLEGASCECYGALRRKYLQLLPSRQTRSVS